MCTNPCTASNSGFHIDTMIIRVAAADIANVFMLISGKMPTLCCLTFATVTLQHLRHSVYGSHALVHWTC